MKQYVHIRQYKPMSHDLNNNNVRLDNKGKEMHDSVMIIGAYQWTIIIFTHTHLVMEC